MKKSKNRFVVIMIIFLICSYSCKTSLIAYYPFNGNADNYAAHKMNGIVQGATLGPDRNGMSNSSYYFDGNHATIKVKGFGDAVQTDEITVSMWVKSLVPKAQFQMMLCPDDNRFAISIDYFHDGRNTIFWDYGWQGEGGDAPGRLYYRPEPFDTLWHHYVFVSSILEKSMKIYKDKILLTSKNEPKILFAPNGKDLIIGSGDHNCFFKGYIDDIRIYNRVLHANGINQLFEK